MKLIKKLETMIELVGSNVVAQRPTDIDLETTSEGNADEEPATPRAPLAIEDDKTKPYQTPVALTPASQNNKNKARVMEEPEDTPSGVEMVEKSDIEMIRLEDISVGKEWKVIRAADKVCTIFCD